MLRVMLTVFSKRNNAADASVASEPPDYDNQRTARAKSNDSPFMTGTDAFRFAAFFMIFESAVRLITGAKLLVESGAVLKALPVLGMVFGLLQLGFACWGLYLASQERVRSTLMNAFTIVYGILSLYLIFIVMLSFRTIVQRSELQYIECGHNPRAFGRVLATEAARRLCDQHVLASKFSSVLLQGMRLLFQLLLTAIICKFRRELSGCDDQIVTDDDLPNALSQRRKRMPSMAGVAAPAYSAAPSYEMACRQDYNPARVQNDAQLRIV